MPVATRNWLLLRHGSKAGHSSGVADVDARRRRPRSDADALGGSLAVASWTPSHPALVTHEDPRVEPCLIPCGPSWSLSRMALGLGVTSYGLTSYDYTSSTQINRFTYIKYRIVLRNTGLGSSEIEIMLLIISRCAGAFLRNTLNPSVLSLTECHSSLSRLPAGPVLRSPLLVRLEMASICMHDTP